MACHDKRILYKIGPSGILTIGKGHGCLQRTQGGQHHLLVSVIERGLLYLLQQIRPGIAASQNRVIGSGIAHQQINLLKRGGQLPCDTIQDGWFRNSIVIEDTIDGLARYPNGGCKRGLPFRSCACNRYFRYA